MMPWLVCAILPEKSECTRHRCLLTLDISEKEVYKRSDVLVVGVSSDPVDKQKAFVEKYKLPVSFLLTTGGMMPNGHVVSRFERYRPSCAQGIPNWTGDVGTGRRSHHVRH